MEVLGGILGVIFDHFSLLFSIKKLVDFSIDFHRFWDGFWEPKSLKMSTSCRRDAHFHKIVFFDSGTILEAKWFQKGIQNGAKIASKINKKIDAIFELENVGLGAQNGSKMDQK